MLQATGYRLDLVKVVFEQGMSSLHFESEHFCCTLISGTMKGRAALLVGVLNFSSLSSPTLKPQKHDCHSMLMMHPWNNCMQCIAACCLGSSWRH